jgi:hypothetical protein
VHLQPVRSARPDVRTNGAFSQPMESDLVPLSTRTVLGVYRKRKSANRSDWCTTIVSKGATGPIKLAVKVKVSCPFTLIHQNSD